LKWLSRNEINIPRKYQKNLSILLYVASYPNFKYIVDVFNPSISGYFQIPSPLTKEINKSKGWNDFLNRCFNTKGKRIKEIVSRYFKSSNLDIFCRGLLFKKLITVDDFLNNYEKIQKLNEINSYKLKSMRFFLRNFHRDTIIKFIDESNHEIYKFSNLHDSANQFYSNKSKIILPNSNNLKFIHDYISVEARKIEKEPIDYSEIIKKYSEINNLKIKDFSIEIPPNSHKLIEYGQLMSNCIGGYSNYMKNPNNLILSVYKSGKLKYNIAISNKKIHQFYGERNSKPDENEFKEISQLLIEKNLLEN